MLKKRDSIIILLTVISTIALTIVMSRFFPTLGSEGVTLAKKQLVDEQIRCNQIAKLTVYESPEESFDTIYSQFAFFNPDLYRCFYLIHRGRITENSGIGNFAIIDVYQNIEIANYTCNSDNPCTKENGREFFMKFQELFPGVKLPI